MAYKIRPPSTDAAGVDVATVVLNSKSFQGIMLGELLEVPVNPTGGVTVYTVDDTPVVALDPPTAAARYCRLRVRHNGYDPTVAPKFLWYRSDNTNPATDGTNAFGFLMHGDSILVKLADFTQFKMVSQQAADVWTVYAEWFNAENPA